MNIRSLPHLALLIVGVILLTEWIQESTGKQEDDPQATDSSDTTDEKPKKSAKKSKSSKGADKEKETD